jgi:hypothetical protein
MNARIASMTRAERVERAVKTLNTPQGTVQSKQAYLLDTIGIPEDEFLEALNFASGGAVVEAALEVMA